MNSGPAKDDHTCGIRHTTKTPLAQLVSYGLNLLLHLSVDFAAVPFSRLCKLYISVEFTAVPFC